MRIFTDIEKQLLSRINNDCLNLYSIIDPWIEGVSFETDLNTNSVTFIVDNNLFPQRIDIIIKIDELQSILIQAVNLIKLFEDKGYLLTAAISQQFPNPFIWGRLVANTPAIPYHFPDRRISELIVKYSTQQIFLTPELNKFINDGYITREEVRANRQWRTTMSALFVAIIALLINIGKMTYDIIPSSDEQQYDNSTAQSTLIKNTKIDTTITQDTMFANTYIVTKTDTIKK